VTGAAPHVPVLLPEVLAALGPASGETHLDGTFGAGGYTRALLDAGADVIAIDRDPEALDAGRALESETAGRLRLVAGRYSEMERHARGAKLDGVTLDIGVSSMQLDRAERGFSYSVDGPLDMRMEKSGATAAEFLNGADEALIADVIYRYGDEGRSRRLAKAIVDARPLETTAQLAAVVRRALRWHPGIKKDPAARVFQAIRIHLNGELDELEQGLEAAERVLKPGGRLAVVTFHSLEDRMVKQFLRDRSGSGDAGGRRLPGEPEPAHQPTWERVAKPVRPSPAEEAANPRSRSATLRAATRTAAPPRSAVFKETAR